MAKYKLNDILQLNAGVLPQPYRLAVVVEVQTPAAARGATDDAAMAYQVLGTDGTTRNIVGANVESKPPGQPIYTTAGTFMTAYGRALEVKNDEVFLTLPEQIQHPVTSAVIDVVAATPLLLFRGDDRHGQADVFPNGFVNRKEVFSPSFKSRQGDVDATTGTCASRHAAVGCLFPLIDDRSAGAVDPIRLYVLFVAGVYQTDVVQKFLLDYKVPLVGNRSVKERLELNHWAQEVIVPGTVPGTAVLGYYRVWRKWLGATYDKGIEFKIDAEFVPNEACTVKKAAKQDALTRAADAVKEYTTTEWCLCIKETTARDVATGQDRVVGRAWYLNPVPRSSC